jgi:hypothetical protein
MGNIDGKDTGIIPDKFVVTRSDGGSGKGGKHEGCTYFVLDWEHDPFALPAALAYAEACELSFPKLAADLRTIVRDIRQRRRGK